MILIVVLFVFILISPSDAFMGGGAPNPKMQKFLEKGDKAYAEMEKCLGTSPDLYHQMRCYNKSVSAFKYNTTWLKTLGTIYLTTEQRLNALRCFNDSVMELLNVQGFTKHSLLMKDGALEAAKLYGTRDAKGSVEMSKLMIYVTHRLQAYNSTQALFKAFSPHKEANASTGYDDVWFFHLLATLQLKEALPYSPPDENYGPRVMTVLVMAVRSHLDHHFELQLYGKPFLHQSPFTDCYAEAHGGHKRIRTLKETVGAVERCAGGLHSLLHHGALHQPFGMMNMTLVHIFADYGFTELMKLVLSFNVKDLLLQRTVHGQTALHRAVSSGHVEIAKAILDRFPQLATIADNSGYSPRRLLCEHKYYGFAMQEALGMRGGSYCDDADDRIDDDAQPESNQGGWSEESARAPDAMCDFDVRDANALLPKDFIAFYTVPEKPVMLRGAVRASSREVFRKESFLKAYGKMSIRREPFPLSESFGIPHVNITTVGEFASVMSATSDIVSEWIAKPTKVLPSPLYKATLALHPALFDTPTTQLRWDPYPQLFVLGGSGSGSNSRIQNTPSFNTLAYGARKWALQPPPSAVASSLRPNEWATREVGKYKPTLRCQQYPGDILIIPRLWSSSYVASAPHLGIERAFDFRSDPELKKGEEKKAK